jgi:uncharacterized membrane protein YdjX (TVP38/TMEM64 family)
MTSGAKVITRILRAVVLAVWIAVIAIAVAYFLLSPDRFTASNLALSIKSFESEIWLVYLAMSAIRGFTLLPSTPLVLAGTILYPDQPWPVLAISLAGILISSSLIYFFSEALGFDDYFLRKKPRAVAAIRRRLEHPWGLAFVALWAFFPLVPTDAVCYVAGTTRMNFPKFISAVFVGELALCSIYVFTAGGILQWLA